ncbi:hypothetical protein [Caballeronia sp. LZ032]|uniref:hypothetical protein n=1 Tax=Caballeronia sp. LZ032 TaxID=3038565 RepID=UPI0028546C55|nr:hypothetical protein [Caballeronia sp. LZ032]MDR5879685.1 hypothetical protein [Caballeronia sp. LZ032]
MKRYIDLQLFARRIELALTKVQPELRRLPAFKRRPFNVSSGTDLAYVWLRLFGVAIRPATAQAWINGESLPSPQNFELLVRLVGKSKAWLVGWENEDPTSPTQLEAAQPPAPYGAREPRAQALALIDEAQQVIRTLRAIVDKRL